MGLTVRRGKNKQIMDFAWSDIYESYKENGGTIGRIEHSAICSEMNDLLLREVVFNNYIVKLPWRLGEIMLVALSRRTDKRMVDWDRTHKYWKEKYNINSLEDAKRIENKKIFYHYNEHTNGKYLFWYWKRGAVRNIRKYSFQVARPIARSASAYIKKINDVPYYMLSMSDLHKKENNLHLE